MLISLIAWIYISILCWLWGMTITKLMGVNAADQKTIMHESIICLIGLAAITVLESYFSFFFGLDKTFNHVLLIVLSLLLYFFFFPKEAIDNIRRQKLIGPLKLLFLTCLLIIVIMSTWVIKHPDTLGYHLQIIDSIKNDGIAVGYAQQNLRFGFQSNWFISCAIFGFNFLTVKSLTFVNGAVCIWFIYFVLTKAQEKTTNSKFDSSHGVLWLILLALAFLDYTQIRLTVTSASPDFIVAIFTATIFYIYCKEKTSQPIILILSLLASFALTIKSSAFVLVLFPFLLILNVAKQKTLFYLQLILLCTFVVTPFLIRNYLTSGYIFYPLLFPDVFYAPWRISAENLKETQKYITAYARIRGLADVIPTKEALSIPLQQWLPIWWNFNNLGQKMVLISPIIFLIPALPALKALKNCIGSKKIQSLILSGIGIIGWFLMAPDLRFGVGYFIVFLGILIPALVTYYRIYTSNNKTFSIVCYVFTCILAAYLLYRLFVFFSVSQIVQPLGLFNLSGK